MARPTRAVFLQSDARAEAGGTRCNAESGSVHVHAVDATGGVETVVRFAVLVTDAGRLLRLPLRPDPSEPGREQVPQERDPALPGGGAVSDLLLVSRSYAVVAIDRDGDKGGARRRVLAGSEPAGPRLGLLALAEGKVERSTLLELAAVLPGLASNALGPVVLRGGPAPRQFYVVAGAHMALLDIGQSTIRLVGDVDAAEAKLGSSLTVGYMVGGFASSVQISVVSAANHRVVQSIAVSSPSGSSNGRHSARIPLIAPPFAAGGKYALVACLLEDEESPSGCTEPGPEFTVRDRDTAAGAGAAAGGRRRRRRRVRASSTASASSSRAAARSRRAPLNGSRDLITISAVTSGPDPSGVFDALANVTVDWNSPARWDAASGPARSLRMQFGSAGGRWALVSVLAADATGVRAPGLDLVPCRLARFPGLAVT
eukprot:tig00021717_g23139.t1